MIYQLAENLNKFAWEVDELAPAEIAYWIAHFKIKKEDQENTTRKADAKAKQDARKLPRGTPHVQKSFPRKPKKVAVQKPR